MFTVGILSRLEETANFSHSSSSLSSVGPRAGKRLRSCGSCYRTPAGYASSWCQTLAGNTGSWCQTPAGITDSCYLATDGNTGSCCDDYI